MREDSKEYQEKFHYKQLKQFLSSYYAEEQKPDISRLIEQIQTAEQFSIDKERVLCLFSNPDFSVKYISKNVEALNGFSPDEICNGGIIFMYKVMHWKQFSFPFRSFQWGKSYDKVIKHIEKITEANSFFCGLKLKDKQGRFKTYFIKQRILSYDGNRKPVLSYMEAEDISNIFRGDLIWARFSVKTDKNSCTRAYLSKGKKKEYADILSEREQEVLRLVAEQKNSHEISEILGISKNTVERHRKNMIARTGVVDMTSLLYVSRLCQLI